MSEHTEDDSAAILNPDSNGELVHWMARRPKHVNVQDMVLYPTEQAKPTLVARKTWMR